MAPSESETVAKFASMPSTNTTRPDSATNPAPVALILLAGSLVMLWFVILSGVTQTSPLRQTYFLRADTSNIQGARPISQWTCTCIHLAAPFSP